MSAPIPVPLSTVVIDLASAFAEVAVPPEVPALLGQLDSTGPMVHGYRIVDGAAGRVFQLLLPSGAMQATLAIPGLSSFELVAGFGEGALIEVVEPRPHTRYAELRNLRLGVRFDRALLRPLDDSTHVELSWTGSLRCYPDWQIALVGDPELTLPACEVAGTGIVVELIGVQIDFSTAVAPAPIRALGLDASFRGVYARSGSLRLLRQARFGGVDGIRVDVRDLAIGSSGVTGTVGRYFDLAHANGVLDPSNPLNGELFDGAWQLGIGAVEVGLRYSAVTHFMVDGLLGVPFLNTLFEVRFGMRPVVGGYQATAAVGSSGPISIPVGHGRLDLASFALDGMLDPDGFQLVGTAQDLVLDLDPVRISAGQAGVTLAHLSGRDEFRIELHNFALGPLGTVDRAELLLQDTTVDGVQVRQLAIEAAVPWRTIRPRLAVPDGFPALPSTGELIARLSWREDIGSGARQLVLHFAADLEDVDSLWPFLPTAWRPAVERFSFGFEATYADAGAFVAAATDGTVSGAIFAMSTSGCPTSPACRALT